MCCDGKAVCKGNARTRAYGSDVSITCKGENSCTDHKIGESNSNTVRNVAIKCDRSGGEKPCENTKIYASDHVDVTCSGSDACYKLKIQASATCCCSGGSCSEVDGCSTAPAGGC